MNTDTPELIKTTPDRWMVRTGVSAGTVNAKTDQILRHVTAELVYGHRQEIKGKNDVTISSVIGTAHYTLHGPTAEKSIQEMADSMNGRGYVPEEKKNIPIQAVDQSLLTGEMLQGSISYGPNYRPKRAKRAA